MQSLDGININIIIHLILTWWLMQLLIEFNNGKPTRFGYNKLIKKLNWE